MKTPRLTFSLAQMECVIALQKHLNFAKAARECFVTQPSLSMQIIKLEEILGFEIFDRANHQMTDIGQVVAKQALFVMQECWQLAELKQDTTDKVTGVLRLGIIPTIAPFLLPLFLGSFLAKYPGVTLEIDEVTTQDLILKVSDKKLDVGIFSTPMPTPGLTQVPIYKEPFVLCVAANHPLASLKTLKVSQLPVNEMLLLDSRNCFRDQVIAMCAIFGSERPENRTPKLIFQAGQLETLRQCVAKGLGITLLPQMMVNQTQDSSENQPVKYISFPKDAPMREVSLLHNNSWLKRSMISALLEEIKNSIGPDFLI